MEQMNKITENRPTIEKLVIGTMLKSLVLYGEYKLSEEDFMYETTKFFFTLGKTMSVNHNELDEASVLSFVNTNKKFKNKYDSLGGWETIYKAVTEYGNENNIKAYIDNLAKNNFLVSLADKGFNVCGNMKIRGIELNPMDDLFPSMSCKEVEEFYEGLISSSSVNSISSNNKVESLIIRKKDREELKRGENSGTPYDVMFEYTEKEIGKSDDETVRYVYALPILSNITNGIGNGNGLKVYCGHSGIGKSTVSFFNIVLPMVYRGESAIVFSNEVRVQYFRAMLTSFIACNIFGYYDLTRKKINNGDFTEEEEILLDKIEKFLDDRNFDEKLKFVFIEDFNVEEIVRMSKEYVTHGGFKTILIDTFKAEDSSDASYVGKINENSKMLDSFGNKYQVKVILTMQLQNSTENRVSFLSGNIISECKAVKNVCELLFLMRRVIADKELNPSDKKFYLRPYRLKQDRLSGKWRRDYLEDLDPTREYRLLFLDKSRRGEDNKQILLEFHGKTGHFKEIGYVEHVSKQQLSY
ncbi:MAG: DnaB-like helicase N-terminal domain-containing protein [Cetobacterium sp.]